MSKGPEVSNILVEWTKDSLTRVNIMKVKMVEDESRQQGM